MILGRWASQTVKGFEVEFKVSGCFGHQF